MLDAHSIDHFYGKKREIKKNYTRKMRFYLMSLGFEPFLSFINSQLVLFLFQCLITILLLFIPDVYALINYVSFVEVLFILISILGLLYLRVKQPDAKRPIKVNLVFPIIFLITCGFLIISSFYVSPVEVGVGCLIIVSGNDA